MGVKDAATTIYMQDMIVFADIFNFLIYGGRKVIIPENLHELDTRILEILYGGIKEAKYSVERIRDVLKFATIMMDGEAAYLLLAVENQSKIHYAMPVRNMVSDAL